MNSRHYNGTVIKHSGLLVLDVGHPTNFLAIPDEYQEEASIYRGWLATVYIDTDDHYEYWKFRPVERHTHTACSRKLLEFLQLLFP